MKTKQLFLFILLLSSGIFYSSAQKMNQFWGVCHQGNNGLGTIFSTDSVGSNPSLHYTFISGGYAPAYTKLLQASDGKLYGMTTNGGANGVGVLFSYDPATGTYTQKYDFNGTSTGANPQGSLIQATDGKLYGMTPNGGANGSGILFQYDITSNTLTKKYDFDGTNGSSPYGSLFQASDGNLYGMTHDGGLNSEGVLFQYNISTSTLTDKVDFLDSVSGSNPFGNLIQAKNGKLYGLTNEGGVNNNGVLFEYDYTSNSITKKVDFNDTNNGSYPEGSLIQAINGLLYGITYEGGLNSEGVLFDYNISTNIMTKEVDFEDSIGTYPYGSLIEVTSGKLYGLSSYGGSSNEGTLFMFDASTNLITDKIDFDGTNGSYPEGSLVMATNGKLYGVTNTGGLVDNGILFEYNIQSTDLVIRADFGYSLDGIYPVGPLLKAASGKLYGLTSYGGNNSYGSLFMYDTSTNTLTKKADFNGTNGANPDGALIQAANGKIYGMTNKGGTMNKGVLFVYNILSNTLSKKVDFDSLNGSNPFGALIQANNGKLYGVTANGGINDEGVLFEYDTTTNTLTKKADFDGSVNGSHPYGNLLQASNSNLYGMTYDDDNYDNGVLFEYDMTSSTLTDKIDFDGTNGANPSGSLIQATNGKLYGLTTSGGDLGQGVLFEYDPVLNSLTKKVDFDGTNGSAPYGALIQATNGKLYGVTINGGDYSEGVLFEYNISANLITKKNDFLDSYEGGYPVNSLIEISGHVPLVSKQAEICMVTLDSASGKNLVVWERKGSINIRNYNIYKESWQAGIFNLIGKVPFNQISVFVDSSSNPRTKSDIYYITSVDSNGVESPASKTHETIHLTANIGSSGEINLLWNPYSGYLYRSFKIYRGTKPDKLTLLDSISSNLTSYTDGTPPNGLVFYQVSAVKPDLCYPALLRAQSSSGPYSQSVSNLKDYSTTTSPYLTLSVNQLNVAMEEGSYNFVNIFTNLSSWSAKVDQSWLSLIKDSSRINSNIEVIAHKNLTGALRTATVTISGAGVTPQTVTVIQDFVSSISSNGLEYIPFNVYPNPSNSKVNIDLSLPVQSSVQVEIFNVMGKLVRQSSTLNHPSGYFHSEFDLSDPSNQDGIYYVRLSYKDKVYISKFILTK